MNISRPDNSSAYILLENTSRILEKASVQRLDDPMFSFSYKSDRVGSVVNAVKNSSRRGGKMINTVNMLKNNILNDDEQNCICFDGTKK